MRQQHDQSFPIVGKTIAEQMLASEERNTSKRPGRTVRITVRDPSRKVNHPRKIITEFTGSISSIIIVKPVVMMDIKVSKDKSISR